MGAVTSFDPEQRDFIRRIYEQFDEWNIANSCNVHSDMSFHRKTAAILFVASNLMMANIEFYLDIETRTEYWEIDLECPMNGEASVQEQADHVIRKRRL